MRRPTLLAALAAATALAGCTVKTVEGAACDQIGGVDQCPDGQRCGFDGTCSVAANACGPTICRETTCSGSTNGTLSKCVPDGVCASFEVTDCTEHQDCDADAEACRCKASACDGSKGSFCSAGGELVVCHTEPLTGCPYEDPPAGCGALRECKIKDATSSECACRPSPECAQEGTFCTASDTLLVTCGIDGGCLHKQREQPCEPGETCASGACACPPTDQPPAPGRGCGATGDLACDGATLLRCGLVVADSPCHEWKEERACAGSGLVCSSGTPGSAACVCPPLGASPRTVFADPGAPNEDGVAPTGAEEPRCRFRTLGAAALVAAAGDTVKATGAGLPVMFPEAPVTVKAGVSLVGDESAPAVPANVVLEVDGAAGTTGLVVEAGASVRGVTVRKGASAASTVGIDVKGASPISAPSLKDVVVDAQGAGGAFDTGVLVSGAGSVSMERLAGSGAVIGGLEVNRSSSTDVVAIADARLVGNAIGLKLTRGDLRLSSSTIRESGSEGVKAAAASVGSTRLAVANSFILRNAGTGLWLEQNDAISITGTQICQNTGSDRTVSDETHLVGGIYALNNAPDPAVPQSLVFQGNKIHENGGDQVLIGAGANWNLSAPSCLSGVRNIVTKYRGGGVGVASIAASVTVQRWEWESGATPPGALDVRATQTGSVNAGSGNFCVPLDPPVVPVCPP